MNNREKNRSLRAELMPYMRNVLRRKEIPHKITQQGAAYICTTALGSRQYHNCIEESMCLKQKNGKRTQVVSYNELLQYRPRRNYIVLEKDREKALSLFS